MEKEVSVASHFMGGGVKELDVSPDGSKIVFSTKRHENVPLCNDGKEVLLHALNNHDKNVSEKNKLENLFRRYIKAVCISEGVTEDYYPKLISNEVDFSEEEIEFINNICKS